MAGLETVGPVSTSWLLTKMPTRHLSYISTDLFWTRISTANTKVAFLPVSQHFFVWKRPFYIQSHTIFPIQKICGSVTKKFSCKDSKSAQATNWPKNHQLSGSCLGESSAWAPQVGYRSRIPLVPGDAPGCPLSDPGKGPPTAASHRPRPARNTAGKKRCPEPPDMWEDRWAASQEYDFMVT